MNIIIDSTNFDPSPALNTFIEEKVQALLKLESRITRVHAAVSVDRVDHAKSFTCAFTIFIPGNDIAVKRTAEEVHDAVMKGIESAKRQLAKIKTKKINARRVPRE